jgi:hypothetical protein
MRNLTSEVRDQPFKDGESRETIRRSQPALRTTTWATWVCVIILHSSFCLRTWGQYSIDWFTIDGGGGMSTGGVYSVTGTIGQPDAVTMSGGNFTLQGGFWGIVAAVQTPGAPLLSIFHTTTNTLVVSWPLPAADWLLEAATNLVNGGGVWSEIPPPYQTNGVSLQFTEPSPSSNKFYRLYRP